LLAAMFLLMVEADRLSNDHIPQVPPLKEAGARKGFLEPAEFAKLREELPGYLQDAIAFLYYSGWRKGAMRSLECLRDFDLGLHLRS
jgi:hypothetical protein